MRISVRVESLSSCSVGAYSNSEGLRAKSQSMSLAPSLLAIRQQQETQRNSCVHQVALLPDLEAPTEMVRTLHPSDQSLPGWKRDLAIRTILKGQ